MTLISLTSIPPRFAMLGPVLESLVAQRADGVVLALPRRYARFPGPVSPPPLPGGVELLRCDDLGPASKLLPAQTAYPDAAIACCDDDCLYAPGWLSALREACPERGVAAGSVFAVARLKRRGGLVAQGFAGLLVPPGLSFAPPPERCRDADDLWISAQIEQAAVKIVESPEARARVTPFEAPAPLQADKRAATYERAAACIHKTLGIWPEISED